MSSIGGFKPGDQTGLGTVVRPADIKPEDVVKQVTVDIDLDGKVSQADDKILVKLPPKGVVPTNVGGFESKHERTLRMVQDAASGAAMGGFSAGVLSCAGGFFVKEISAVPFTNVGIIKGSAVMLAVGALVGAGVGAYIRHQYSEAGLEQVRANTVPDMVRPKMILNISE